METYANALLYAIPFFIGLVLFEIGYGHFIKKQMHKPMDTISSLSSGLTNIIKDSLGLVLIIVSYPFLLEHLAVFEIEATWLVYVIAFICIDFASYWNHRLSHKINFFWNQHVIHHSSEEFNLACALRQSISNLLGYFSILLIPAALLGVPHKVIAVLAPIHLFAQFWYHTKHIGKLGILEYIIVTPSQHRVHHAINKEYIDKNLAAIFCVWDRAFGTFQEELDEEPPVYGVLKPVYSWNPLIINYQYLWGMIQDAWHTRSWKEKLTLWWKPTGYRPKDVVLKFPRKTINTETPLKKYNPEMGFHKKAWALFQWLSITFLLLFLLAEYESFTTFQLLLLGGLIMISIFGFTSLMDGHYWSYKFEMVRNFLGLLFFILPYQSEFYLSYIPSLFYFGLIYFSLSIIGLELVVQKKRPIL
jgi:alkylglycerol monooxygenase